MKYYLSEETAREIREAIREIRICEKVIQKYAEAGLAGTVYDVEHHEMLEAARQSLDKALNSIGYRYHWGSI